jgi:cell division protein FtsL
VDLKGRVEKKIFYLFIAITISILGFVYNGIHQVDKAVAVLTSNIAVETRNLTEYSKELKQSIKDVEVKVERHIQQTRHVSGNP